MNKRKNALYSTAVIFILLFGLLGFSTTAQAVFEELQNPGFEDGTVDQLPPNWSNAGAGDPAPTKSAAQQHSDSHSCRLQDPTTGYTGRGIRSDAVEITAGRQYEFNAWFYVHSVQYVTSTIDDTFLKCRLEWRDSNGEKISDVGGVTMHLDQFDYWYQKAWTQKTAPDLAVTATLYIAGYEKVDGKNDIYIDDAYLGPDPTVVGLSEFQALGYESGVWLWWLTVSEIDNAGFNLYRSENRDGPYTKLNPELIPGLGYSVIGRLYWYTDTDVIPGKTYYYKLEDVDFQGNKTMHGPVWATPGKDSDNDGIPDGWEERYGLNPFVNDGGLDPDNDGFTNYEEFLNDTNPFIPDREEVTPPRPPEEPRVKGEGIEIIESDESGVTLELTTDEFREEEKIEEGISYQRISIPGYIHGHSSEIGKPQVPMKGVLLGVPSDSSIEISVLDTESTILSDYNLYPVPQPEVKESGNVRYVAEIFTKDEIAYSSDAFYPDKLAETGYTGLMRNQKVVQIKLYPIQFNPVTKELRFYKKIRLRLDFSEQVDKFSGLPRWKPKAFLRGSPVHPSLKALSAFTGPTYKLYLSEDGIYRLTSTYLQSQGIDLSSADPKKFKVYNKGKQILIYVYGEDDGTFDSSDYIEFYGKAETTKYTSTNVYWLITEGSYGQRMTEVDGTPGSASTPTSFLSTNHYEVDSRYRGTVSGGEEVDRWFFQPYIWGGHSKDFTISLTDVNDLENATIRMAIYGCFDIDPHPNHHTKVYLNGHLIEDATWDGQKEHLIDVTKSETNLLQEGNNTITIEALLDTGAEYDLLLANWFEIDYWRAFKADSDSLKFNQDAGNHLFQVSDFSTNNVEVFDITNESGVKRITNLQSELVGSTYTISFEDSLSENREYLALTVGETRQPTDIQVYTDSNIYSTTNGADYIIITYDDFYDENDPDNPLVKLKDHREDQGLRVKVVKIKDVYDEFNYGIFSPYAIKNFLTHTYNSWIKPAPTYVLLVGDATYDYKDNTGMESVNYLPVYLLDTKYMGETASDNWFVCVNDDNDDGVVDEKDIMPDMYIGRLPVKTAAEVEVIVNKILNYEETVFSDTWEKNILCVADDKESIFKTMNNNILGYLPSDYQANKVYLESYATPEDCKQAIIDGINNGTLIVNYVGHAGVQLWAHEYIFRNSDISSLSNASQLPLIISMTCLDGYFIYPYPDNECLAEELLRAKDDEEKGIGAIAVFTSTGATLASGQKILDEALFQALFGGTTNIIGNAISQAKMSALANGLEDIINTFDLLGDPALELKIPLPAGDGHTHGHTCPIATAAYGTFLSEEVEVFRNFRDEYLLTHRTGQALVRFYYRHSPPISKFIEKKKALKTLMRAGLKPILWLAKKATKSPYKYPMWE